MIQERAGSARSIVRNHSRLWRESKARARGENSTQVDAPVAGEIGGASEWMAKEGLVAGFHGRMSTRRQRLKGAPRQWQAQYQSGSEFGLPVAIRSMYRS